jgi:glycine cleavage system protein P-like pyridoxal-binding family
VVLNELKERGILGGIDLSANADNSGCHAPQLKNAVLIAVTEMNSVAELDKYAEVLSEVLSSKTLKNTAKKVLTV